METQQELTLARQTGDAGEADRPPGGLDPRLATVVSLVPGLAATFGGSCEVVVHDLSKAPNSIVAIAGNLTGRPVGGPITDLLHSVVSEGETEDLINYCTETADGRAASS